MMLKKLWNQGIPISLFYGLLFVAGGGILVGSISYFFMMGLEIASNQFQDRSLLLQCFTPIYGILSSICYNRFLTNPIHTGDFLRNTLDQRDRPQILQAFFIFFFTILSQLFGISTGREGSAVQYGAISFIELKRRFIKFSKIKMVLPNTLILSSGIAAGIGSVFGVPWTGILFALEPKGLSKCTAQEFLFCGIASFVAHFTANKWGLHHFQYPEFKISSIPTSMPFFSIGSLPNWFSSSFAQLEVLIFKMSLPISYFTLLFLISLASFLYLKGFQIINKNFLRIKSPHARILVGGLFILGITFILQTTKYSGLGTHLIEMSFNNETIISDLFYKYLLLIIAIASGFKGGEITPIMSLGSIVGSIVNKAFNQPSSEMVGLAIFGLLGGIVRVPWTATIMITELMGIQAFLPALLINLSASFVLRKSPSLYDV